MKRLLISFSLISSLSYAWPPRTMVGTWLSDCRNDRDLKTFDDQGNQVDMPKDNQISRRQELIIMEDKSMYVTAYIYSDLDCSGRALRLPTRQMIVTKFETTTAQTIVVEVKSHNKGLFFRKHQYIGGTYSLQLNGTKLELRTIEANYLINDKPVTTTGADEMKPLYSYNLVRAGKSTW